MKNYKLLSLTILASAVFVSVLFCHCKKEKIQAAAEPEDRVVVINIPLHYLKTLLGTYQGVYTTSITNYVPSPNSSSSSKDSIKVEITQYNDSSVLFAGFGSTKVYEIKPDGKYLVSNHSNTESLVFRNDSLIYSNGSVALGGRYGRYYAGTK